MNKRDVVQTILRGKRRIPGVKGCGWAPSNLALSKYWGKRSEELNLPFTSSISISLGHRGAFTVITPVMDVPTDDAGNSIVAECLLNGQRLPLDSSFVRKICDYLTLFELSGPDGLAAGNDTPHPARHPTRFMIHTTINIPLAAGFASSACGFAALALALDDLYDWQLSRRELSILARLGSGSACRSLHDGFVMWHAGVDADGFDSYGSPIEVVWPEFCVGALILDRNPKPISSRVAMSASVRTSPLYPAWEKQANEDVQDIYTAVMRHDFIRLGEVAERNALAMHAVMRASVPPVNYNTWETLRAIERVQQLRQSGIPVYLTQDAGPNLQLLFTSEHRAALQQLFPEMEIVMPFADYQKTVERLASQTHESLGPADKLLVHRRGDLHRAFSVVIARTNSVTGKREMLLQQRSAEKYHSAGKWSNACCGHPQSQSTLIRDAAQRVQEELGVKLSNLQEVASFVYRAELGDGLVEHELDHLLLADLGANGSNSGNSSDKHHFVLRPDPREVQDCCWVEVSELRQQLAAHPEHYSSWLPMIMAALADQL